MNNELGNVAIDRRNTAGAAAGQFWAYQSFVAPSTPSGSLYNEAFLAVSGDGGQTWQDRAIPCSIESKSLDHNFPNVSVAPDGSVWFAWSDDTSVYTATSADNGSTWTCSPPVSSGVGRAIFPWLAATSRGVDRLLRRVGGDLDVVRLLRPELRQHRHQLVSTRAADAVHSGAVCEGGVSCTGGRQLLDDFAVDTDLQGWAHIAYSHDAPDLGGGGSFTGYAVQTGGTRGYPN